MRAQAGRQPPGAAEGTQGAQNRAQTAPESTNGLKTTTESPTAVAEPSTGRVWRLWFPARMGPAQKVKTVINGHEVKVWKSQLDLPPTKNNRLHWRVLGPWIREWRQDACDAARWEHRIPRLERIRVSGIVYRKRLGIADAMNDLDRLHPLVDGLQDAGVIDKDTRRFVEHGTVTEQHLDERGPGILLIVEALPAPGTEGE